MVSTLLLFLIGFCFVNLTSIREIPLTFLMAVHTENKWMYGIEFTEACYEFMNFKIFAWYDCLEDILHVHQAIEYYHQPCLSE